MIDRGHFPRRGSDVERWITFFRDCHMKNSPEWFAFDLMLDEYRECSDTGRSIRQSIIGMQGNHCSHKEIWFSRTLCNNCHSMHYYCSDCGAQNDECLTSDTIHESDPV